MTAHSDALIRLTGIYAELSETKDDDEEIYGFNDHPITVGDIGHAVAAMTFVRQVAREGGSNWWMAAKRLIDDK